MLGVILVGVGPLDFGGRHSVYTRLRGAVFSRISPATITVTYDHTATLSDVPLIAQVQTLQQTQSHTFCYLHACYLS